MSVIADSTKRKRPKPRPQHDPQYDPRYQVQRHGEADAQGRRNHSGVAVWGPRGWLTAATDYDAVSEQDAADRDAADQDPLVCHGDWLGPQKLITVSGKLGRLTEVFVSHELFGDQSLDFESSEQRDALFAALDAAVFADRLPVENRSWRAPETAQLVKWLGADGFQPAVDDDGNLRLTLKARGCDGQVRLCREDQRLRLTMRLGSWSDLDRESETAMLDLARQANDRGRLARIAWIVDGPGAPLRSSNRSHWATGRWSCRADLAGHVVHVDPWPGTGAAAAGNGARRAG